jgi:serine/threonine-protein kinase
MAYTDMNPNGTIRGILGYLKPTGEVVNDRYRIGQVLGKGGFGSTYLVQDLRLQGKRRALKEIPRNLFDEHEVKLLSQLNHPSIPDITDRFENGELIYLVLEFGGTRTLGSECQRMGGRISLDTLLPWMQQLCDALAYLHSQTPPVIHRDLKPENVLLDENTRIMLIDFGIAKESLDNSATRMLARAGSHGYSPPEQVLGAGTEERSDIYSLGATFYRLLTGQTPPPAHERVAGKDLPPPSSLLPDLPSELDDLLRRMMSLNLNQRPSSIQQVKSVLEAVANSSAGSAPDYSKTTRLTPDVGGGTSGRPITSAQGVRITTADSRPIGASNPVETRRRPPWLLPAVAATFLVIIAVGATLHLRKSAETGTDTSQPVVSQPNTQPRLPMDGSERATKEALSVPQIETRPAAKPSNPTDQHEPGAPLNGAGAKTPAATVDMQEPKTQPAAVTPDSGSSGIDPSSQSGPNAKPPAVLQTSAETVPATPLPPEPQNTPIMKPGEATSSTPNTAANHLTPHSPSPTVPAEAQSSPTASTAPSGPSALETFKKMREKQASTEPPKPPPKAPPAKPPQPPKSTRQPAKSANDDWTIRYIQ